jgi:hypothetical protein
VASRDRVREIVAAQLRELHGRRDSVLDQLDLDRLETLAKVALLADKIEPADDDEPSEGSDELERRLARGF